MSLPRRALLGTLVLAAAALALGASLGGCGPRAPAFDTIGRPGTGDGEFRDPRGIAVSDRGIAVLDRTGRMQVFDLGGRFRRSIEVVPGDVRRGLPTGALWLPDGSIAVAHTHQSRIVVFAETGETLRTFGDYGVAPGQFLYPQRIALDAAGDFVISEYGIDRTNRVQVLRPDGAPVRVLGGGVEGDGGLGRPMGALPMPDGTTIVADEKAGLVRFGADGRAIGRFGPPLPEGSLPRGICRDDDPGGDGSIYVIDGTLSLVRWYAPDGTGRGVCGRPVGAAPDPSGPTAPAPAADDDGGPFLREPWDIAWFAGRVYVADMGNHRVVRIDPRAARWRSD